MDIEFKRDGNTGWIKLYINNKFIKKVQIKKEDFLNNDINIKQTQIFYKKKVKDGKILQRWTEEENIFQYTIKR